MGLMSEIAVFFLGLIGIYAVLHDFLGLNIIPYSIFDNFVAPSFAAFLFIFVASVIYWLYRIKSKPLQKKAFKILKLSILVFALGIFYTSLPQEALTTSKLILGKLLLISGLALGVMAGKVNKQQASIKHEQNEEQNSPN